MAINEVQAKKILQKSRLPGADYVINPYTGCTHGCVYCYARFMKRFSGHTEPWGTFLDAKVNGPEVLRKQLEKRQTPLKELVFLSSVTDPYIPAEATYELTRKILWVLLEFQVPIEILTKSDLVMRDVDILYQFKQCSVGMSLMSTDSEMVQRFETHTPPPERRLRALQTLKANGIKTYAFISPYIPQLCNLERLLGSLDGMIDEFAIEAMHVRGGDWARLEQIIERFYPEYLDECKRDLRDENYWTGLEKLSRKLAGRMRISFGGLFRH